MGPRGEWVSIYFKYYPSISKRPQKQEFLHSSVDSVSARNREENFN